MRTLATFKKLLFIVFVTCLVHSTVYAEQKVRFVTFSQQADFTEGDDDFRQSIYFTLPKNSKTNYQLQIFDPEISGALDEEHKGYNSKTQFRLFAATKNGSYKTLKANKISYQLVATKTFGNSNTYDKAWASVFDIPQKTDFSYENSLVLYRLMVSGLEGDDGNVFDVRIVDANNPSKAVNTATIFSFSPTVYIPVAPGSHAGINFILPSNAPAFNFEHFDIDKVETSIESLLESRKVKTINVNGRWHKQTVWVKAQKEPQLLSLSISASNNARNAMGIVLKTLKNEPIALVAPYKLTIKNQRPVNRVSISSTESCQTVMFDASNSTDAETSELTHKWSFGDDKVASGAKVTHTYSQAGKYKVELQTFDDALTVGRGTRSIYAVTINAAPVAKFTSSGAFAPNKEVRFNASTSVDKQGKIKQYLWDFGDGTEAEGVAVRHTYSQAGAYKVTLKVAGDLNATCQSHQVNQTVLINATPKVDAGEDKIAKLNVPIEFVPAKVFDAEENIQSYLWDFGDGQRANTKNAKHSYKKAGVYKVSLTVTDTSIAANNTAVDSLLVTINARPVAVAGFDKKVSLLEKVYFDASASSDPDGKIGVYLWDFGDGAKASGKKVSHTYNKAGTYQVNLTIKDDSKSSTATATDNLKVVVNAKPIAKAKYDFQQNSSLIQFDASKSIDKDGRIGFYHWQFGDGLASFDKNPLHAYGNPGIYKVKLTVKDDSGSQNNASNYYFTVKINGAPIADAGGDRVVAPNIKVHFDGSKSSDIDGNIARYVWTMPNGTELKQQQISYSFAKPGDYPVSLKVTDLDEPSQSALDSIKVHVNYPPTVKVPKKIITSPGHSVLFDATNAVDVDGKITKIIWHFSDSHKRYKKTRVLKSFKESGIYFAHLTVVDDAGVENSIVKRKIKIEVNNQPVAIAGNNVLTCEASVTFDASNSLDSDNDKLSYLWDFGDGSDKKSGAQAQHTYNKPGIYPVVLSVNDDKRQNNSEDRASLVVRINEPPVADAGLDKVSCAGSNVVFDGASSYDGKGGLLKYNWGFGDGTTGTGLNPTKVYKTGGTYSVKLKVEDNTGLFCGKDEDEMIIKVVESPVANAGQDMQACANSTVSFNGSKSTDSDGLVNSYFWDFGDDNNGGGATPAHAYTKAGIYNVKLTITGDQIQQCDSSDSDFVKVTVLAAPIAQILAVDHVALTETVVFDGSNSSAGPDTITNWLWDFGDGTTSDGEVVEHQYAKPGKYDISLTIQSNAKSACNSTYVKAVVLVNASPVAKAGSNQQVEINDIVAFDASRSTDSDGGIINYFWDFGDGTEQSGVRVDHQYKKAGTYTVKLLVTDDSKQLNGTHEDEIQVLVSEAKTVIINTANNLVCNGDNVALNVTGLASNLPLIWSVNDERLKVTNKNISYRFNGVGRQTVKIRHAKQGTVLASKTILINQPPQIALNAIPMLCVNEATVLSAKNSTDDFGKVGDISWKVGDKLSKGSTLRAIFSKAGSYPFEVSVSDDSGLSCNTSVQKGLIRVNNPPKANAGGDKTVFIGSANDNVIFDAKGSYDKDNDSLNYRWYFNDGSIKNGKKVSYQWKKPGKYQVKLIVSDNTTSSCATSEDIINVTVKPF